MTRQGFDGFRRADGSVGTRNHVLILSVTGGMVWLTLTPLLGMSEMVRTFLDNPTPERHVTHMTIDDAFHYTEADRARRNICRACRAPIWSS